MIDTNQYRTICGELVAMSEPVPGATRDIDGGASPQQARLFSGWSRGGHELMAAPSGVFDCDSRMVRSDGDGVRTGTKPFPHSNGSSVRATPVSFVTTEIISRRVGRLRGVREPTRLPIGGRTELVNPTEAEPKRPTSLPSLTHDDRRWLHDKYERLASEEGQLSSMRTSYYAAIGTVLLTGLVVVIADLMNQPTLLAALVTFLASLGILISLVWAVGTSSDHRRAEPLARGGTSARTERTADRRRVDRSDHASLGSELRPQPASTLRSSCRAVLARAVDLANGPRQPLDPDRDPPGHVCRDLGQRTRHRVGLVPPPSVIAARARDPRGRLQTSTSAATRPFLIAFRSSR